MNIYLISFASFIIGIIFFAIVKGFTNQDELVKTVQEMEKQKHDTQVFLQSYLRGSQTGKARARDNLGVVEILTKYLAYKSPSSLERHSIYLEISEIARGASISRVTTIVLEMAKEGIDQDDNVEYDKLCYYFDWATNPVFVVGFFKTKGWSDEKGQWNPSYRPLRSIDVPLSKVLKALTEAHASEFRRIWGGEASHKV